jgi:CBS domain-containing protein
MIETLIRELLRRPDMEVQRMMRHSVRTCHLNDSLNDAAQIMWEDVCGSVPVVDDQLKPVGLLTDRDICMAAYTQGAPLYALRVESAMARRVVSCRPTDDIDDAARVMAQNRVRRLPVVGDDGKLIGLLTLGDLACESQRNLKGSGNSQLGGVIAEVYGSICAARCQRRHGVDPPRVSSAELR